MKHSKHRKHRKHKINYIQIIFIIIFILSVLGIGYYLYSTNKEKQEYKELANNIEVDTTGDVTEEKTERMVQLEELQKENADIVAWIEIEGTNISYPILQTNNNEFYLTHNYKKEKSSGGSLFLDKDFDIVNGSSNYLIYGHRHKQGLMFEDLMKYAKEDFYKEHTKIKFTTLKEDVAYEIISVFYSRVYYQNEQDVFRYYYFVNAENETEYNNYIEQCKKASIYNIETTAEYGEQLLTLSTCSYHTEDGRFVVVAKKVK